MADFERNNLGRRFSDHNPPMTAQQVYELLNYRMQSMCNEIKETKQMVQQDHDLVVSRTADFNRIRNIEEKIEIIFSYINKGRGAVGVLISISALIGALLAWAANKYL